MPIRLEKDIEKAANKILGAEGWLVNKVAFLEAGYPDRLYIHLSGIHVWIEYKRPGEKPSPLQNIRIRDLMRRNVYVYWADNSHDAVAICRSALVSESVPSGRYQNATGARGCRFIPGPWPWEDFSGPSGGEDPQSAYVNQ